MLRGATAVLLALALFPAASAGTSLRPDVTDAQGDGRTRETDILAAWLDPREEGLRFGLRMAEYDDRHHIYWVVLTLEETGQEIAAVVGYGGSGQLRGALTTGPNAGGLDGRGTILAAGDFDRAANGRLIDLSVDGGRNPNYEATIPWGSFDGLEPGAAVAWVAGNTLFEGRQWTGAADMARSEDVFVASIPGPLSRATAGLFPILVPAWVIPFIVVACVASGMGGGWWADRAARAKPAAPAPRAVAVRTIPPPGERFRHAPPPTAPGKR